MTTTRSEIRKLTTLRLTGGLVGTATMLSALIGSVVMHTFGPQGDATLAAAAQAPVESVWFFVVVVGVLVMASEFRHGTIVTTLLATPRRGRVLAAKALVATGFGAGFTAVGSLTGALAAVVTGLVERTPLEIGGADEWALVGGAVLVGGLWGLVACGLGLLTRSTAVAVTVLLLWKLLLEGLAPVLLRRPGLSAWTPGGAADALVTPSAAALSPMVGALVLTGYAGALCALAAVTFVVRDAR